MPLLSTLKSLFRSPVTQLVTLNTILLFIWRTKQIEKSSPIVKHFSYQNQNIKQQRYYTMITYSFSHFGFISYLFDMIVLITFGNAIKLKYGNKIIWLLYLLGAFAGALSMNYSNRHPLITPKVGSQSSLSSLITFYGLLNRNCTLQTPLFSIPMWIILVIICLYSILDPSRKSVGGICTGFIISKLWKIQFI